MIDLSEHKTKCIVSMGAFHHPLFGSNTNFSFFSDENFLVSVGGSCFQVWSLDKGTEMADEMTEYASHRRIMIHTRLERQRARNAEVMARVLRQEEIDLDINGSVGNDHAFQKTES